MKNTLLPRRLVLLAAASAALAASAQAQDFPPAKPVTLVVGFAAGGAADAAARLIAKKLAENIGQSVVVENKGGAGGNIAHQQVAAGAVDGSLLLFGSIGPLTIAPHLMKVGYDPFKDLAAVSGGVNFPNVLVVHKGTGVKTLAEFVQLAKKKAGGVDFASTGAGSASHLAGELFNQQAGIDMVHVPYKGGAPALQDLIGERVASYFSAPPTAMPHVEAGKLVPLATTGLVRPAYLPQIPDRGGIGLPRLRGPELVCLRRTGQDAYRAAGPLEPGDRQGAERPRRQGCAEQARPDTATHHARRTDGLHEEGRREVERDRAGAQDHGAVRHPRGRPMPGRMEAAGGDAHVVGYWIAQPTSETP